MRTVYLDHNATTPLRPEVADAMRPFLTEIYGNPSSIHAFGREASAAIEHAREALARAIGADPSEILFTSGGTEADNAALLGASRRGRLGHVITSAVEHHAVLHVARFLEEAGGRLTVVPVGSDGRVDPDDVRKAIAPDTGLISIMHANNETGTLQPVAEIGAVARTHGIPFHTDAVQSLGKVPVDVNALGVDLLSLSAHKACGPKGVGALYVRRGTRFSPLIRGGAHEGGRRAGTENVAGIVGFGLSASLAVREQVEESARLRALSESLWSGLAARIDRIRRNGHPDYRTPNTLNISFYAAEGESVILSLDLEGVAVSSGSACTSGSEEPSHVLLALGLEPRLAQSSVRFSLGRGTSAEDLDYVLEVLPPIVERLRSVSALA